MKRPAWWAPNTKPSTTVESSPTLEVDSTRNSINELTEYYNSPLVDLSILDPQTEAINIFERHASNDKQKARKIVKGISQGVEKDGSEEFFTMVSVSITTF